MYLPKGPKKEKENPFAVQKSRRFITASAGFAFLTVLMASYFALEKTRERQRRPEGLLRHYRRGQRVVIIGAGAAGSALSASLANASPDLHVTVIEQDKKHVFQAMVPLAHVGHRSYDLNTTGGVDFLRSPATWNVTRDALLVRGEVIRVDTSKNEVVVLEHPTNSIDSTAAAATAEAAVTTTTTRLTNIAKTTTISSALKSSTSLFITVLRVLKLYGPDKKNSGTKGLVERRYQYDALVIACGAERVLGPLQEFLSPSQVDRHRIAVNPGITRDCLAHLFSGTVLHIKVPPASFIAGAKMRYPSRQHDGTFIGTVNTIWRYLCFFNKLSFCPYIAVTADQQPSDVFPATLNEGIMSFWRNRGVDFITSSYLTHVDPRRSEATLYNYTTKEKRVVPYQLLVLDLPLAAPAFIRESGLSSEEAEGFVDVHHHTLQHRSYANIFAIGDCAALPTVKSYGAVFAQVPVVSHNVRQVLQAARLSEENSVVSKADTIKGLAKYNGYSSFHIVMTTWRAMWPEMLYGGVNAKTDNDKNCLFTVNDAPLLMTNHHIWDNLAWIDVRGFLNAAYYQFFLYELMFYFLFTRAVWYPPTWFSVPTFSEENGQIVRGGLL
ncbi:FAD/NAD(P)-binding domain [Trypanosoma melophagium]|uniref:FAD/NAD(P)-binding domain n=1 Tax=Trypanosoma melophagium TaxID=715481 RepID=UPI00351AAD9C|nr:FAD/NAD(P)-binding domain [Trypanosoma melophagium]